MSFRIRDQDRHYGVRLMETSREGAPEHWQTDLLEAVARHIGIAINLPQRSTEQRRLALLEERGVIARELSQNLGQPHRGGPVHARQP